MIIIKNHKKELKKLDAKIHDFENSSFLSSVLSEDERKTYTASLHHAKASLYLLMKQYEKAAEEEDRAIGITGGENAKYFYQSAWIRHLSKPFYDKLTDTLRIKAGLNAPDGKEELHHFCDELGELAFTLDDTETLIKVLTFLELVNKICKEQNGMIKNLTFPYKKPGVTMQLSKTVPLALCNYRDTELEGLKAFVKQNRFVVVHGFGGIGKTALVRRFFHDCIKNNTYDYVAWVDYKDGSLRESLIQDFLSTELGEAEKNFRYLFWNFLQEDTSQKLLVIDNVERGEARDALLSQITGTSNLTIILTSRASNIISYPYTPYTIDFLSEDDCINLFIDYYKEVGGVYKESQRETVRSLVRMVHFHTLSIEILAKSAKREDSLEDYLAQLNDKGFAYPDLPVDSDYGSGSTEAWHRKSTMALYLKKCFDTTKCSAEQIRILRNFALMPSVEIPWDVESWIQCEEKDLKALTDSGWLDIHRQTENTPAGYYMHPLVKETLLLDKKQFPASIGKEFVDCLTNGNYIASGEPDTTAQPKLEIADDVLTGMGIRKTAAYGAACDKLATAYRNYGWYEKAEEYFRKAIDIREMLLGTEHPDTAATYTHLAVLCYLQGRYSEAEKYFPKALAIYEKVLGTEHPDIADLYNNIAKVYEYHCRYSEAEGYFRKARTIREKVLGTDHPDTASAYNGLEEYFRKAIAIREKVLGTDHPDTATTYNGLAGLYYLQGRYSEAEEYFHKVLAIREKVLGTDHPDTASAYNGLAGVYFSQDRYEETEEYLRKAIDIREKVLGTEHPDTADTYNKLALLCYSQGKYGEAAVYYLKAHFIQEKGN